MKKTILRSAFLAVAGVILTAGGAMAIAIPFSSTSTVDSNYGDSWDVSTFSGTALYSFYIDDPTVQVNQVSLEFESDIFDLSSLDASDFTMINPVDWVTFTVMGINYNDINTTVEFSISYNDGAGTAITSANDPIQLTLDYILLGADRYSNVDGGSGTSYWDWDEGQAWAQSYTLDGNFISGDYTSPLFSATSGGSTAPVPEPATMLLFGTGLIGLAGFSKRKKNKKA